MRIAGRGLLLAFALSSLSPRGEATVEMQNQAKKLGFAVGNCLYCHATPHAAEAMKAKAKAAHVSEGNCLACHGGDIPAALNHRGDWLVAQKAARGAKDWDMAWLKDYKEPTATPAPKPKPTPTPASKDVIKVQPDP
jgi:mono/diheme cytochrome c family protein